MADQFVPAFEFQDWNYQSFLILPTPDEGKAQPGSSVTAKKWAMGKLTLSDSPDGYEANGFLDFGSGVRLEVKVNFQPGEDGAPASFEANGIGEEGLAIGSHYHLTGWAFPGSDGKVEHVQGAIRAVRGPDSDPQIELGQMPIGTVGAFHISKSK